MTNACNIPSDATNNVLSFEDWSAKVRAIAAAEHARIQAEKDEYARRMSLFDAFRL